MDLENPETKLGITFAKQVPFNSKTKKDEANKNSKSPEQNQF
jgi:hypothetical protein